MKIILRIENLCLKLAFQDSGRKAYIGIGFADRSDSFDLNVTLQDHFKWLKKEDNFSKEADLGPKPNLDLAFKEGQTIRINIPKREGGAAAATARPQKSSGLLGGPPPPPEEPRSALPLLAPAASPPSRVPPSPILKL